MNETPQAPEPTVNGADLAPPAKPQSEAAAVDETLVLKALEDSDARLRELSQREHALNLGFALPLVAYLGVLLKELLLSGPRGGFWGALAFFTYSVFILLFQVQRIRLDVTQATIMLWRLTHLKTLEHRPDARALLDVYRNAELARWSQRWSSVPWEAEGAFALFLVLVATGAGAALLLPCGKWVAVGLGVACLIATIAGLAILKGYQDDLWAGFEAKVVAFLGGAPPPPRMSRFSRLYFRIAPAFGAAGFKHSRAERSAVPRLPEELGS